GINYSTISGATNTTYSPTPSSSTYYRVKVTCDNSNESAYTDGLYMKVGGDEQITSTVGATICGEGNVTVSATGNADNILWYDSEPAVLPIYYSPRPSDYTSFVNTTTTFYAAAANGTVNTGHVGPAEDTIGNTVDYYNAYTWEVFTVSKACTIVGFFIDPAST